MWLRLSLVLGLVSCATTHSVPTEPVATLPAAEHTPSVDDNEALSRAWAPESVAPQSMSVSVKDAPTPTDRRAPFRELRDATTRALRAGQIEEARVTARKLVDLAQSLHGEERDTAGQLHTAVELAANDESAAQAAILAWRRSCGPEVLDVCRSRALAALAKIRAPAAVTMLTRLKDAETCVAQAALGCVAKTEATASAASDDVLLARAGLARALAEKNETIRVAALERVEKRCQTPGCVSVRRRALRAMLSVAQAHRDLATIVRLLVRDDALAAASLEPELRVWARSKELDDACARLDGAEGVGACRKLEKETAGTWSFRDFSKNRGGKTGLTTEQVRLVNQHYAPLLQECLTEQAHRMVPPDAQEFEVRWVVHNDGHVRDAHLRKDLDASPFAECLRTQFVYWRYPKFDGEFQNVQQNFTVTATTRYSSSY